MKDKKVFQILTILRELGSGNEICVSDICKKLDVSERSVQRYIKDIEEFYGIGALQKTKKGCYASLGSDFLSKNFIVDIKDRLELERFNDLIHIISPGFFDHLPIGHQKSLKKLRSNFEQIYKIKENPFEEFVEFEFLDKLKKCIKYRKYCDIRYFSDADYFFEDIKPIKIAYIEGNWYLASISNDTAINNGFKFLRISFIKEIVEKGETFYRDVEVENFLDNFQTLFSSYKEPYVGVLIEIDSAASRFFRQKKFLKSQQIVQERDDGSLLLRFQSNSYKEIELLVKKWLPYARIIEPLEYKKSFEDMLRGYFGT